ncbi:MAG TPA: hypothetical protein VM096_13760 [Vicinamibacterales bacterium]|nr:hypothetical protein [Vicinamibacterales bacterium]
MSPSDFTFKLTVPNDPEGATVAAVMATHAVEYAGIDATAGAAFVERVRAGVREAVKAAPPSAKPSLVMFSAANGQLTVTVGGTSISQPLPA